MSENDLSPDPLVSCPVGRRDGEGSMAGCKLGVKFA